MRDGWVLTMKENHATEDEQELCRLLIQLDLLTRDQVNDAFLFQCRLPNSEVVPIEEILVEMELISASMLERVKETYHKATMIYGRQTGPLSQPAPTSALKHKAEARPMLQPMQLPIPKTQRKLENAVCMTSELRLTPELQAVIKGKQVPMTAPVAQELQPVEPMSLDEIPFAELNEGVDLHTTLALGADNPHRTLVLEELLQPEAKLESQDIDPFEILAPAKVASIGGHDLSQTLIIPPPAITPPAPELPPLSSLGQQPPICLSGTVPQPEAKPASLQPASRPQLSLPDLSARLSKSALPPQIGEILLKNHDLEEWQLMHALCIQKETPAATPRLGTLLIKLGYANRQTIERALSIQLAEELRSETRKAS